MKGAIFLLLTTSAAFAQFDLSATVDKTLEQWQKNNRIVIEADAMQAMRRDVGDAWPRLDEMARLQAPYEKSPEPLVQTLVRTYCFDLRDGKLRERRTAAHALQFQPAGRVRIEHTDVRRFSFLQFIAQFFPRLEPVGYLDVASKPDQADISIDNQPKGFTNRVFVVSVGSHTVLISSVGTHLLCTHTIRVAAGRTGAVKCP